MRVFTMPKSIIKSQANTEYGHRFAHTQVGFTLIELMISMVIGLLIIGAALALMLGGVRNVNFQESADDVQDAAVFGFSYMQKEIAMSNLGAYKPITQQSAWTGVVLTLSEDHPTETIKVAGVDVKRKIGNLRGIALTGSDAEKLLTQSKSVLVSGDLNNNVDVASDQLTIEYQAPFDLFDCEGAERLKGQMVVERFFTRQDTISTTDSAAHNIVLACDAGWYILPDDIDPDTVVDDTIAINNFGDDGAVLINRLDYFGIRLGVQNENKISYMPINDYMTKVGDDYTQEGRIVAVQMGAIVRGVSPVDTATNINFTVFDEDNALTINDNSKHYIRRVYKSTIRLRNGNLQGFGGTS